MKNRILSIVLAVLTVMSVIPFTFLSAAADGAPMPDTTYGFYYGKNGAKGTTGAEAIWVDADVRSYDLVGLDVKSGVEFDGHENLKSIKIGTDLKDGRIYYTGKDGTVVTSENFGVNFCMYNNPENYRDECGRIPLYGEQMYVSVQYYYDTTDRDETDEIGVDLTGKKMKWLQWGAGVGTDGAISNKLSLGAESEPIVANKWTTAVFNLGAVPSTYVGGRMGQNKIYYLGDGNYQMKKGDVMYIGDTIIWSKDPTVASNYPTDTATVKLYANSLDYGQGFIMKTAAPTYLTSYALPEFPAESLPENGTFLGWIDANDTNRLYQPGDEIFINRRKVEDFYAKVTAPVEVSFVVGESTQNETWYSYTTVTLPAAPAVPEGQIFIGWRNDDDSKLYAAGASYDLGEITSFVAEFGTSNEITFTYGETSFVEQWAPDTTVTLPAAPVYDPEDGTVFMGWKCSADDKIYAAGRAYKYDGSDVSFAAYYAELPTVYYSKTAIDGVDSSITFDTLAKADAYIASMGGIGTIIVNGTLFFENQTDFASSELTISGYDSSAKVSFTASAKLRGNDMILVFKDIIITVTERDWDEAFVGFGGIDVTFDESCGFEQGTLTGKGKLNIYFGTSGNDTLKDQKITFNSPQMNVAQIAPLSGWNEAGGMTLKQNTTYVVNAGSFTDFRALNRNGSNKGKASTIEGDTTIIVNGGQIKTLGLGTFTTHTSGTVTYIINGGTIKKFVSGALEDNKSQETAKVANLIQVINAKSIIESGANVPTVGYGAKTEITGTGACILNNAELVLGDVNTDYVSWLTPYRVAVYEGKADYKIVGKEVKFTLTADNAKATEVYVNDVLVEADEDGYYPIEKSQTLQKVTFGIPDAERYTVTYSDGNGLTVDGGSYYPDSEVLVLDMHFTNGKKSFDGYAYNGTTYNIGDTFKMPAENVVLTAKWRDPASFTYYVASTGVDTNDGKTAETPFATINKAIKAAGTNNAVIVVMDRVKWFSSAINSDVTVTGKDPASGTVYENASLERLEANFNGRVKVTGNGSFTLSYIEDYNPGAEHNHPIQPSLPEFTIGEGFKAKKSDGSYDVEVSAAGCASDMTINLASRINFADLSNWSTLTYNGSVTFNVLPTASFTGSLNVGNDTGNVTVNGPLFVNVYDNQNNVQIKVGGSKTVSKNNFKGGLQVLSINSNNTVADSTGRNPNTIITGGEYYVKVGKLPEGAQVISSAMGKLTVVIPEGYEIARSDANGIDKISKSGVVTLAEGNTDLSFVVVGDTVTVNFDDGETDTTFKGMDYVVPGRESTEAAALIGWMYDGAFYAIGSVIKVPTDATALNLTGVWANFPVTFYVDAANGNDTVIGNDPTAPVKTLDRVSAITKNLSCGEVTVKIIGTYGQEKSYDLPTFGGKLIIDGDGTGILTYGEDLRFRGETEFRNITLKSTKQWKQMSGNGHNITFGDGFNTNGTPYDVTLHAGLSNQNMNLDQTVTVNGGVVSVQAGPYYIDAGSEMTWTGNFKLVVNGGRASFTGGDGYPGADGTFKLNGNILIEHNGGTISNINKKYMSQVNGKIVIVSKPETGLTVGSIMEHGAIVAKLNGVDATVNGTTVTFNEDANLVNGANFKTGDTYELAEAGIYNFRKGANVSAGLTVDGAQIRLDDPQALRFIAKYTAETEAAYADCEYGFVVLPTKVLNNNLLKADASYTYNEKNYNPAVVPAAKLYDEKAGEYKRYTAAMTGFTADTYATEYTAVTYIKKDGAYIYGEQYSTSIYAIAKAALEDTTITEEARTYFQGIVTAVESAE